MSIPFTGEYWMFQWPWTHPPDGSIIEHGTPRELTYRATNGRPMETAAVQKLDPPVDLTCCRSIQVLLVAEPEPGATLEMVLGDGIRVESLAPMPVSGTVTFSINGSLRLCNEIKLFYHRAKSSIRSPKIAVDSFVMK